MSKYVRNTLAGVALMALTQACYCSISPGYGEKVGQIVKLAKVGLISETWEAEIVRGGFTNTSGVNGTSFDFTITNDGDAALAKQYMENQTEVRIKYHTPGIASIGSTESGHFLVEIAPAKREASK